MPAEFDDLSRRLSDLESDVSRVHMAGPTAARRRGRQRTRNRAIAVTLGTAAAAVIGGGVLNALPQSVPSVPEPAETPTEQPDPSPNPSPETEVQEEEGPLDGLLLGPDDLAGLESPWADLSWTEGPLGAGLECSPAGPDGVQTAGVTLEGARTAEELGEFLAWADERIFVLASEAEADAALTALRSELGQCATDRDDVELTRTWEYDGIGDAAFQSEIFREQLGRRIAASIGAARTGSTLVVTVTYVYIEGEFNGQAELLAAAVAQVCAGDCVGEISQQQTFGASGSTADVPFLLDEEVNPVGSYTDFVRSDTMADPSRYVSFCLPELVYPDAEGQPSSEPVQVGGEAPTIYQGVWFGPSEGGFYQTVMHFLNAQEAADFVASHSVLPEQCGDVIETHEQAVNQPVPAQVSGADEAIVWTIDESVLPTDPGSEPFFGGVGMARSDNDVVIIGFSAFGDPTGGTWADYAAATLALALDRVE